MKLVQSLDVYAHVVAFGTALWTCSLYLMLTARSHITHLTSSHLISFRLNRVAVSAT